VPPPAKSSELSTLRQSGRQTSVRGWAEERYTVCSATTGNGRKVFQVFLFSLCSLPWTAYERLLSTKIPKEPFMRPRPGGLG